MSIAPFLHLCHVFLTCIFRIILSVLLYVPLLTGQDFTGRVVGIGSRAPRLSGWLCAKCRPLTNSKAEALSL